MGLVNVFVPLVPLSEANGPTALALCSHRPPRPGCPRVVRPLLAAGELLVFDWRTWHRGGHNATDVDRPVACVAYNAKGVRVHKYKDGLPSLVTCWANFPLPSDPTWDWETLPTMTQCHPTVEIPATPS